MAINPLSDIVLDVTKAADPHTYRVSVEKLQKAQANPAIKFDAASHSLAMEGMRPPVALQTRGALENPHRKFEAFMLQNFIMNMFTSDTTSVFGSGAGADFWKDMLAEKMADEMAHSGGIGVAAMLDAQADKAHLLPNNALDEAAASVLVNKSQINFMRYVSRDKLS